MTSQSSHGRTLPHSVAAEEMLLGCCFLDAADMLPRCEEAAIVPESFYEPKHGIVFETMRELYRRNAAVEAATVAEELKIRHQLDLIGGYAFIAQVSGRIPTTAEASYFIERVREYATLRQIIRTCTGAVEDCYNHTGALDQFSDDIERRIFAVTQSRLNERTFPVKGVVTKTMETLTRVVMRKGELTGVSSGFKDLDRLTWGFQKSEMLVLAARPSMGKTSLAMNFVENVILPKSGRRGAVLVFSLEMSNQALMQRMICSRARVNMKLLRDGLLSKNGEEMSRLIIAADELAGSSLYIDDSSSPTAQYIRAKARRVHSRTPLAFIVVDYLQLISASDKRAPREQQVAEASMTLKAVAKELDLPILVLSQLNRSSEKEKRVPRLSDLRESGAIEQDADVVMMLARPNDADDKFQVAADSAELIIAKQRNGPVGEIKLTFLRDIVRFENFHP